MLTNPRHESFTQGIAAGLSAVQAYIQAGFSAASAEANAHRLMVNDGVQERIAELRRENEAARHAPHAEGHAVAGSAEQSAATGQKSLQSRDVGCPFFHLLSRRPANVHLTRTPAA